MKIRFKQILFIVWFFLISLSPIFNLSVHAQADGSQMLVLTADGPITPAMAQYLSRGIKIAERQGAEAVIFQLNTPGGSVDTMTEMEQMILASKVPVIVYVAPAGAMAASAGTIITLAGHASSMAPQTMIGAASPVGGQGEDLDTTEEAKVKNATAAAARSLTERRGPTAVALAEDTIKNAAAVSASEALQAGLIDFISVDLNQLRSQLDGFTVSVAGQPVTLHTADAIFVPINISIIEQALLIVTDPNIVFLLITIGVQALIFEITSPGGWVAGFIGVVCTGISHLWLGYPTGKLVRPTLHRNIFCAVHPGHQSAHPRGSHCSRDWQPNRGCIGAIQHPSHTQLPARLGAAGGWGLGGEWGDLFWDYDDCGAGPTCSHPGG